MKTGLFSVEAKAWFKGLFITCLTTLVTGLYGFASQGTLPTWAQFKPYLISSFGAGLSYIITNYLSNSQGQLLKKETPAQVAVITAAKEQAKEMSANPPETK